MAQYNLQNEKVTTDDAGNVISSASLQPKPTIQPATPTPDTTDYNGITGGVTQSIINDYASLNAKQQEAQTQQQNTGSDILSYMQQLTNKTADTQAANEAAGVNTETANLNKYAQTLTDLNAQASSLNREAQAIPLQVQENNRNTGATDAGVAPQSAGALRLNALKALSIGQQADIAAAAATGSQLRLQAAKDKAQQIVDLKYKPLEDMVAIKQKQYDLNKDVLDSIDKKRSEALQVSLQKEAQDLADRKAKEQQVQNVMLQAAKYGADPATLSKIQNASSIADAIKNSGNFLSAEFRNTLEQQAFDNKVKLQQIAISRANLAISQAELGLKKQELDQKQADAKAALQATPELMAYAQQYASTGQIPSNIPKGSFGVLADIAKSLPKENGYLVDKNTGIKSNGVNDTRQESIVSLYDIVAKKLPILEEKFKSIDTGPIGRLGAAFYTTQDRQDFRTARQEILNLLIKARSGAAVSEPEYNRYLKLVPGELSITGLNQIKSLGTQLKNTLDSQLQGSGLSIYGYSKVNMDGNTYTAGDILDNGKIKARVNPDGTLSLVQ